ncbi:hypothetical protein [Actinocorallia longicatena]|uniref:DUF4190 domain-containing protein n=1 Tax=Actinocorallia longicatena TaxID=111803 RepID=A0ABP6QF39_9ACTN
MTLPGYRTRIEAPPEPRGLGMTALTLGVIGLLTFWMCGLGMLVAAVGIAVGVMAVIKGQGRIFAFAGIALSVLALAIAAGALVWFGRQAVDCRGYAQEIDRSTCMEAKFPLLKAHPAG